MNTIIIFFDIVLITTVGYIVGSYFLYNKSYSLLKKIALSYGMGFGIFGFQLFFYNLTSVPWSIISITCPWILLICIFVANNFYKLKIQKLEYYQKKVLQLTVTEKILTITILLLISFVGIESILRPIQAWDGWDNWILRPNVFYTTNTIDKYYFKYTTDEYPLIMPLTITFGYITLGEIDDRSVLLFYFAFYLALGALFYAQFKEMTSSNKWALTFTFLLLSTQNLLRHGGRYEAGQADLTVGFYIFSGTILLIDFLKTKSPKSILLLSIFLGISSQIKNDMMPFVGLAGLIVCASILLRKRFSDLLFVTPLPILYSAWVYFKEINALHVNFLLRQGVNIQVERIPAVFFAMIREFFNIQNWSLIWIIFLVMIILYPMKGKKALLFLVVIFFQWLSYLLIFLITPMDPVLHVANVINKLYLHLLPLAVMIIGLKFASIFKK